MQYDFFWSRMSDFPQQNHNSQHTMAHGIYTVKTKALPCAHMLYRIPVGSAYGVSGALPHSPPANYSFKAHRQPRYTARRPFGSARSNFCCAGRLVLLDIHTYEGTAKTTLTALQEWNLLCITQTPAPHGGTWQGPLSTRYSQSCEFEA